MISAYRGFGFTYRGRIKLVPLTWHKDRCWQEGLVTTANTLPTEFNKAGLYCYKTLEEAKMNLPTVCVFAEIGIFGHIVEHELGFRAEKAIINRMFLTPKKIDQAYVFYHHIYKQTFGKHLVDKIIKQLEDQYQTTVVFQPIIEQERSRHETR